MDPAPAASSSAVLAEPEVRSRASVVVLTGTSALVIATVVAWLGSVPNAPTYAWLSCAVLALGLAGPLLDLRNSRLDLLSPTTVFSLVWIAMFAIRPLLMAWSGDTSLRNTYNFPSFLAPTLWMALLTQVCFLAGLQMATKRRTQTPRFTGVVKTRMGVAVAGSAVGAIAAVLGFQGTLGGTSAYFYYLPLVLVPISAACWLDFLETRALAPLLLALIDSAVFLIRFGLTGQRAFVLYLVLSLAVIYYLRRGRTPGLGVALLAGVVILGGVFYGLEVQRAEYRGSVAHPGGSSISDAAERVFLGGTTEMAPAMSVLLAGEGSLWEREPGRTVAVAAVHWIPSSFWSEKPKTYDEVLYSRLFPEHYSVDKANVQFSIMGDFYTDSGWLGVVVGGLTFGFAASWLYERTRSGRSARLLLIYSLSPLLLVTTLRGNIALNMGIALFLLAPIALIARPGNGGKRGD